MSFRAFGIGGRGACATPLAASRLATLVYRPGMFCRGRRGISLGTSDVSVGFQVPLCTQNLPIVERVMRGWVRVSRNRGLWLSMLEACLVRGWRSE